MRVQVKAAAGLLLIALAAPARADRVNALRYFRSGERAYQAQNFAAAAQSFYQAYQELPLPEIAFSAAQAYRRQYRVEHRREYVERAVELYRFYLEKVKTGGRVGDAADNLGEMEAELARLGGPAKPVVVEKVTQLGVTVSFAGTAADTSLKEIEDTHADVPAVPVTATLDGKPVDADKMVDVAPGDHVFHVEAAGFLPADKKGIALEGRQDFVEVELQPLPAHLAIDTEDGARITIDSRGAGTAPIAAIALPAGRHVVTIVRRGRVPVSREVVLERGQTVTLDQPLAATRQRRATTWIAIGAGGLAVTTGVLGLLALSADGTANDKLDALNRGSQDASVLADYRAAKDRRDTMVTATWIAGGATVIVGAVAAVMYFADNTSAEGIHVTPYVSGSAGGAAVIGRF